MLRCFAWLGRENGALAMERKHWLGFDSAAFDVVLDQMLACMRTMSNVYIKSSSGSDFDRLS